MLQVLISSKLRSLKSASQCKSIETVVPADLHSNTKFSNFFLSSTFGVYDTLNGKIKIIKSGTNLLRSGSIYTIEEINKIVLDHNVINSQTPVDLSWQL